MQDTGTLAWSTQTQESSCKYCKHEGQSAGVPSNWFLPFCSLFSILKPDKEADIKEVFKDMAFNVTQYRDENTWVR